MRISSYISLSSYKIDFHQLIQRHLKKATNKQPMTYLFCIVGPCDKISFHDISYKRYTSSYRYETNQSNEIDAMRGFYLALQI